MSTANMQQMDLLKRRVVQAVAASKLEPAHVIAVLLAQIAQTVKDRDSEGERIVAAEWTMRTLDEIFTHMLGACDDPTYVKPHLDYGHVPKSSIN
jgi:hypothetical protein